MASRRRLAVPAVLAGVIALGAAVPALASGSGSRPHLPKVSPAQLVGSVLADHTAALYGGVAWTPDLGLPSLSALTGGQGVPSTGAFDPTSLLTTSQTFQVWLDGSRQRVQASSSLAESDIVRNGTQVWLWNSANQTVAHRQLPAPSTSSPAVPGDLARQIVSHLRGAGTAVTVGTPVDVAGQPCQVLQLAPADQATSTVSAVDIAVDAAHGTPLQVTVFADGQNTPALQVGFGWVKFAAPDPSVFAVPQGKAATASPTVVQPHTGWTGYAPLMASPPAPAGPAVTRVLGTGWSTVVELANVRLPAAAAAVASRVPQGRVLSSSLLNALFLPDGHALVGFVPPAVLEADAG